MFRFKAIILILILLFFVKIRMEQETQTKKFLTVNQRILRHLKVRQQDILDWAFLALEYNSNKVNSLKKIYRQLDLLSSSPFGHVKLQNLTIKRYLARIPALTPNGNYIPYMNISVGSYIRKPCIFVVGGIYGSDWLGVTAIMNIINEFSLHYYKYTQILEKATWILIPVLNPDGYNETLSNENRRNWQKNMARPKTTNQKKKCFGVDLCLNFEFQWLGYNYKNMSWCNKNYADKPFSQNESQALRDTVMDHLDTVTMFVVIKQIRRAITYPYRYTEKKSIFSDTLESIAQAAAEAAQNVNKRAFDYGHILNFEGKSAGDVDDWIRAHFDVQLAFTCFISNWNNNNRMLSYKEISQTNDETLAALKAIVMKGAQFNETTFLPINFGKDIFLTKSIFILFLFLFFALN